MTSQNSKNIGHLQLKAESEFLKSPLADRLQSFGPPELVAANQPLPSSPRDLVLSRHRGSFVKPCPATLNYTCCGLNIFHFGLGCSLACRYCILEAYLETSSLVLFGNIEDGLAELESTLAKSPDERPLRFCTGEFTDSLLLDKESGLGTRLVEIFAERKAVLELKTKTTNVDHLLKLKHQGHTVISFSVNAPQICRQEEPQAPSLKARLEAARRAADAGYPIGLHFDPLIFHPNWQEGYSETIGLIDHHLKGATIAWVSLGCFRYLPPLKEVMLARYAKSKIFNGEFIMGGDGKMRYPRPLRARIYRHLARGLREILAPETTIYFCMESPRLWRDVFGQNLDTHGLTSLLDQRARQLFGA